MQDIDFYSMTNLALRSSVVCGAIAQRLRSCVLGAVASLVGVGYRIGRMG